MMRRHIPVPSNPERRVERRRILRGRLGGVSVIGAMSAGSWVGFGLGLAIGAVLGALLCWFADAALRWQHDLGLTLGVAQNLLPLGDQVTTLETISRGWYIVVPVAAFLGGLVWGLIGGLVAGLVAASYNRASRRAVVLVEVPESELEELGRRFAAREEVSEVDGQGRVVALGDADRPADLPAERPQAKAS